MPYRRNPRKSAKPRRYGGVRRRYQKRKVQYRKKMSVPRKRVLNLVSRKKRDDMISYTNIILGTSPSNSFATGPAFLQGGRTYVIPWICTARSLRAADNTNNTIAERAARTATDCYMRGLAERIQVQTSSGAPWQWRRMVFCYRRADLINQVNSQTPLASNTTSGIVRTVMDALPNTNLAQALLQLVFQGTQSVDWSSLFTAKMDTNNVDVKYDKTRIIRSGNASGVMKCFKMWHPMNKNLRYADDELADTEVPSLFSTGGRAGMGDMYVVDIISAGTGSTSADQMSFEPSATLYWHEK